MQKIRHILLIIVAMATTSVAAAANSREMQQAFAEANQSYDSGNYEAAIKAYQSILDGGYESWELYFNLGNAYYRADDLGHAILNYERAHRMAPNKKIINDNIALARSKTTDNIEAIPPLFIAQWFQSVIHLNTARGWRIIVIILSFISAALLCIFLIAKEYRTRKTMFIAFAAAAFFFIISIINATISTVGASDSKRAVIVDPMVVVKGSPDAKAVDKFVLHEGTTVKIDDMQDRWWLITIADGKSGWIDSGAEKI